MSYTREAMPAPMPATQTPSAPIMREDRAVDPYRRPSLSSIEQAGRGGTSGVADTASPAETVTLSPAAAALARKEQASRQMERKLKEREEALEAKAKQYAKYEAMEQGLAKKDYSALKGIVNYDEYTQAIINEQTSTDPTQAELQKLKAEIESVKKASEDQVSKQFDAAVNERKVAASKLLETDPELSSFNSRVEKSMPGLKLPDAITHHILDTWEHDSKELSVEEATKEVVEALKAKAKGWSALLEETQELPATDEKKTLPPMKPPLKTITNQVTAGDPKKPTKSFQQMNETERYEEARRRAIAKMDAQTNR